MLINLFKIWIIAILICVEADDINISELPSKLDVAVEHLITTGQASENLTKTIEQISKISDTSQSNEVFCQSCHKVFDRILKKRRSGANIESMKTTFKNLCYVFTDWGKEVCDGYIDIEIDAVLFIIDNRSNLTSARICAIEFQYKNCKDPDDKKWNVDLPPYKELNETSNDKQDSQLYKVLQLTDFHFDPFYKPGSNSDCGMPLCCQESSGVPKDNNSRAGYWADYNACDMPWHSVEQVVNEIREKHQDFEYIFYTGDIISHKSWATSKENNVESIKAIFELFEEAFNKIPIYPILGNHEPHPCDFYSPIDVISPKITTNWLFETSVSQWSRWLPESTKDTILKGGYYTVLIKPGLRLVALNSNVCYTSNLWLLYQDKDPYGQLEWLVGVLTEAEKNGEKVHIISHIPPGEPQCYTKWSHNFATIVNRFANIIVSQFNGHTHNDELRIFYNMSNPEQIVNVAFNGGSFTTYVGVNPNYRIYYIDSKSYKVNDYDQHVFNVTEANLHPGINPRWFKLYSLKEAYDMKDTDLQDFDDLYKRMKTNDTLVQQYHRFRYKDSDIAVHAGCSEKCIIQNLCSITAIESESSIQCDQVKAAFANRHHSRVH